MIYRKNTADVQFRIFSLSDAEEPRFEDFISNEIDFDEHAEVLEILHEDGTKVFVATGIEPEEVSYQRRANGVFTLPSAVPSARIWVRPSGSGVLYKVPASLPKDANNSALVTFEIHSADPGVTLVGDEYFNKVYHLTRH